MGSLLDGSRGGKRTTRLVLKSSGPESSAGFFCMSFRGLYLVSRRSVLNNVSESELAGLDIVKTYNPITPFSSSVSNGTYLRRAAPVSVTCRRICPGVQGMQVPLAHRYDDCKDVLRFLLLVACCTIPFVLRWFCYLPVRLAR